MEREFEVRISRRHRVPALPDPPANPATARNWLIYFGILVGLLLLMTEGGLDHAPSHAPLPQLSEATDVISTLAATPADSLEVVVAWELTLSDPAGRPDSVRVRVMGPQGDTVTSHPAGRPARRYGVPACPRARPDCTRNLVCRGSTPGAAALGRVYPMAVCAPGGDPDGRVTGAICRDPNQCGGKTERASGGSRRERPLCRMAADPSTGVGMAVGKSEGSAGVYRA